MNNKIHIPQKLAILTLLNTVDVEKMYFIGDVVSFIEGCEKELVRVMVVVDSLPDLALLNGCYRVVRQPDIEFKGTFKEHYSCSLHFDEFSDIRIELLIHPRFKIESLQKSRMLNHEFFIVDWKGQREFLQKQVEHLSLTKFVEVKNTYTRQLIQYTNGESNI